MASLHPWFHEGRPVLVTGGRGFLGSHLAIRLASLAPAGCEVVVVDNGTRDCLPSIAPTPPANVRLLEGDIREPESWLPDVGAPSVVLHCAALAGVSTYYRDPFSVMEVNGLGTARLLAALEEQLPSLFVHLSTSEVYGMDASGAHEGRSTSIGPVPDPRWTYGASKLFGEHLLFAFARKTGLPSVVVRPFNVYGPGQLGEGAIRNFAERAVQGDDLLVTGDGSAIRSWVYVDDLVEAVLALAATPSSWGASYNVGNPDSQISTAQLARLILDESGGPGALVFEPHPGQEIQNRWPSIDAIRAATGWEPRVALAEGVARTVQFWRSQ
ncbi:MAG: epimerase [Deltaproteobacteria bacterium]|nr:epimerase [Deltaproteobacteria bacterium]